MRISFRTIKLLSQMGDINAQLALKLYVRSQCDLARCGDVMMRIKHGAILVCHDFVRPLGA